MPRKRKIPFSKLLNSATVSINSAGFELCKECKSFKYTNEEISTLRTAKLETDERSIFLHCKTCLPKLPAGKSASEWMNYYAASVSIKMPKGNSVGCVVLFCKNCDKPVWDTRHLKHAY